jgi:hypothetical protein
MTKKRAGMTVRIVPLHSAAASDARVSGTASDRLALVGILSARAWTLTGRPFPQYTRSTMPIRVTLLGERTDRD